MIEEQQSIEVQGVYLQNKMNFNFLVSSMEYFGDKVFIGSSNGGLYAYAQVNNRFKLIFCKTDAHPSCQVSQLQAASSQKLISSGYEERKLTRWKIQCGFQKEAESRIFKTFVYQIAAQEKIVFAGTLKKIYALDASTLDQKYKFVIPNYQSIDFLISSLGFFSSPEKNILIGGTDTYKRNNYFLTLWEFPIEESDIAQSEFTLPKVRKLSNLDDLDNFDLDGEVDEIIEPEQPAPCTPKFRNPQLLEFSHSSRITSIKCIGSQNRFISLSQNEINIWAVSKHQQQQQQQLSLSTQFITFPSVQQVYSLRFEFTEINSQMTLSYSNNVPIIFLFLNSTVLALSARDGELAFQGQLSTSSSRNNQLKGVYLQPFANGISAPSTHFSPTSKYSHPNHFILRQPANTQGKISPLRVIKHVLSKKKKIIENVISDVSNVEIENTYKIEPIEEEPQMEEEPLLNFYKNQVNKSQIQPPSTAHIVPSTAQVTILQNQLKRIGQSKLPSKHLPQKLRQPSTTLVSNSGGNQRKNPPGQLRSNSKQIKKLLKREVKFNNKRKKKFKNNNNSVSQPIQFWHTSSPNINRNHKPWPSNSSKGIQSNNKLTMSPREMAIAVVQSKQQQPSKKQNNNSQQQTQQQQQQYQYQQIQQQQLRQQQQQQQEQVAQQYLQQQLQNQNYEGKNHIELQALPQASQTVSKQRFVSPIKNKNKQFFMQRVKQEFLNSQLVALDSSQSLGCWKIQ